MICQIKLLRSVIVAKSDGFCLDIAENVILLNQLGTVCFYFTVSLNLRSIQLRARMNEICDLWLTGTVKSYRWLISYLSWNLMEKIKLRESLFPLLLSPHRGQALVKWRALIQSEMTSSAVKQWCCQELRVCTSSLTPGVLLSMSMIRWGKITLDSPLDTVFQQKKLQI